MKMKAAGCGLSQALPHSVSRSNGPSLITALSRVVFLFHTAEFFIPPNAHTFL